MTIPRDNPLVPTYAPQAPKAQKPRPHKHRTPVPHKSTASAPISHSPPKPLKAQYLALSCHSRIFEPHTYLSLPPTSAPQHKISSFTPLIHKTMPPRNHRRIFESIIHFDTRPDISFTKVAPFQNDISHNPLPPNIFRYDKLQLSKAHASG